MTCFTVLALLYTYLHCFQRVAHLKYDAYIFGESGASADRLIRLFEKRY